MLFLEKPIINDLVKSDQNNQVHLAVIGKDLLILDIVKLAINNSVYLHRNRIVIDIFSPDSPSLLDEFCSSLHPTVSKEIKVCDCGFSLKLDGIADGQLEIRVLNSNTPLIEWLNSQSYELPFTYFLLADQCEANNMRSLEVLLGYVPKMYEKINKDAPTIVIYGTDIGRYLEILSPSPLGSGKLWFQSHGSLALDIPKKGAELMQLMKYNHYYNILSSSFAYAGELNLEASDLEMSQSWNCLSEEKKMSNTFACWHLPLKSEIVISSLAEELLDKDAGFSEMPAGDILKEYLHLFCDLDISGDSYDFKSWGECGNLVRSSLLSNSTMRSLMELEHRRWSYFSIMNGWGYTEGEKDNDKKLSPYLCSFEKLSEEYPDVTIWDLIGYLVLMINGKSTVESKSKPV